MKVTKKVEREQAEVMSGLRALERWGNKRSRRISPREYTNEVAREPWAEEETQGDGKIWW